MDNYIIREGHLYLPEEDMTQSSERSYKNIISKTGIPPYYSNKKEDFTLFQSDCLGLLTRVPNDSIDMIFADPPYFLSNGGMSCHAGKRVSVNKGTWDKSKGVEETHQFNIEWLKKCQDVLAKDGTIWVSGTSHIIFSIGFAMQQLGFKILNDISWDKVNPPPNLSCRYFTHTTETVIWAAKNKSSKHYFNYALMRRINNNKQMKSLWSIMAPRADEKTFGKHPTQKPIALLERIILASTKEHDIILDPFAGSSTTGIAAHRLNRFFVGIDNNKEYLDLSIKRLSLENRLKTDGKNELLNLPKKLETPVSA